MFEANNVYIIFNAASGTALDLSNGSSENGTRCQGWKNNPNNISTFNREWLITVAEGNGQVFTLCNLHSGTYLDLKNGSNANGTQIQGWSKATSAGGKRNQQWRITQEGENYRLQNVASGTLLDLSDGHTANGTKVQGWKKADVPAQNWGLHRVSRAGHEVDDAIKRNFHTGAGPGFNSYLQDGLYIVLPAGVRNDIYHSTGLSKTKWRKEIFDCDDFAFVAKAAIAKWGNENLRADGIAILFGIMFGESAGGVHVYNWYFGEDLNTIMFFEPQSGEETANPGYTGYFGVF